MKLIIALLLLCSQRTFALTCIVGEISLNPKKYDSQVLIQALKDKGYIVRANPSLVRKENLDIYSFYKGIGELNNLEISVREFYEEKQSALDQNYADEKLLLRYIMKGINWFKNLGLGGYPTLSVVLKKKELLFYRGDFVPRNKMKQKWSSSFKQLVGKLPYCDELFQSAKYHSFF